MSLKPPRREPKNLAGHVRLNAESVAEFAPGWNDSILSKEAVSLALTARDPLTSRRWLHAYATSRSLKRLAIKTCTCGAPKTRWLGLGPPRQI